MATDQNDGTASLPAETAPLHGLTLVKHAQISAEIAEGDRRLADILGSHRLIEEVWNESGMFWMSRIGDDVRERGENAQLPIVYSDAFSNAQDALKPLPPTDAGSYAKLVVDIQLAGGPDQPLATRGLSMADFLRLSRHWARVLSADPVQAQAFFDAYQSSQPAPSS